MNAVESIVQCVRHGGTLQLKDSDLDLAKPGSFPASLVDELKCNKLAIVEILKRRIMIVRSRLDPEHPMFWCGDEDTRDLMIDHGAEPGQVWVREELAQIVSAQPDRDALSLIIAAKREFGCQVGNRGQRPVDQKRDDL